MAHKRTVAGSPRQPEPANPKFQGPKLCPPWLPPPSLPTWRPREVLAIRRDGAERCGKGFPPRGPTQDL
jgi:hypothetical protein